jgi:hypothetical protein
VVIERVAEALLASLFPNVRNQLACAPECCAHDQRRHHRRNCADCDRVRYAVVIIEMWPWFR